MTNTITWWEYDELVEHLSSRPDIWTRSDENEFLWLRSASEEGPDAGLLFSPPSDPESPFRCYALETIPLGWDEDYLNVYITGLLTHWTSFSVRKRTEEFLIDELHIDPQTSHLSAIALESFDWTERSTSITETTGPAPLPDSIATILPPPKVGHVGTWLLAGGGYVRLDFQNVLIRATISIPSEKSRGYGPPLEGFVRPYDGRTSDAIAFLSSASEGEIHVTTDCSESERCEGLSLMPADVGMEADSESDQPF